MLDEISHARSSGEAHVADRLASLRSLRLGATSSRPSSLPETGPEKRRLQLIACFVLGGGVTGLLSSTAFESVVRAPPANVASSGATFAVPNPGGGAITAAGYVVARRRATVAAEITGRITSLPVGEGDLVRRGDVLATLDGKLARSDLATQIYNLEGRKAAVASVSAQLTNARIVNARTTALRQRGFATGASLSLSVSEQDRLEAQLREARSDLSAAEVQVGRGRRQLSNFVIRAPFDGVVTERNAQVGEIISPVSAGGYTRTGLCTIVDMGSLDLEVEIAERYISRIKVGQHATATLDAYPDVRFPVIVTAVIPTVNRERATVTVQVAFLSRDDRVMPSMAVKVAFGA